MEATSPLTISQSFFADELRCVLEEQGRAIFSFELGDYTDTQAKARIMLLEMSEVDIVLSVAGYTTLSTNPDGSVNISATFESIEGLLQHISPLYTASQIATLHMQLFIEVLEVPQEVLQGRQDRVSLLQKIPCANAAQLNLFRNPTSMAVYPLITPPALSSSELLCKNLDDDTTNLLIDKWLDHRHDTYPRWFDQLRERKHVSQCLKGQLLAWNKGDFAPENFFCRTIDTGRVVPLDRTWTTHIYYHRSMQGRKLSMLPVVYTMLPELMLLRGMHERGCDNIYIIVTDLDKREMDDVSNYFSLVCRAHHGRNKPNLEKKIRREHIRISQVLHSQQRLPCLPQIDITFRAILNEKKPPFIVMFSYDEASYSQIFFTSAQYVPSEELFHDFPNGCPNPSCTSECEMVRFPRRGPASATVLPMKGSYRDFQPKSMCNWTNCDVSFIRDADGNGSSGTGPDKLPELRCSKCRVVSYCCSEHQKKDWEEHKRFCVKAV